MQKNDETEGQKKRVTEIEADKTENRILKLYQMFI